MLICVIVRVCNNSIFFRFRWSFVSICKTKNFNLTKKLRAIVEHLHSRQINFMYFSKKIRWILRFFIHCNLNKYIFKIFSSHIFDQYQGNFWVLIKSNILQKFFKIVKFFYGKTILLLLLNIFLVYNVHTSTYTVSIINTEA